jgi:class 3 adenylate cyclase
VRDDAEVVFLLTDIVGSSARWEQDEESMATLVERHDELIEAAVVGAGGTLVKHRGEGDSTFSVFSSAGDAMRAALLAQRGLRELEIGVRMAVHAGAVQMRAGDFYGTTVNRAARLRSVATSGEVLVSAATAERSDALLPEGGELVDLGKLPLRGMSAFEHVFRLAHPDLVQLPVAMARPPMSPLFSEPDLVFVGRDHELAVLRDVWEECRASGPRVVFVGGEPGVGKTALVRQLARSVNDAGGAVLAGRCEEGVEWPYQPYVEAFGESAPWLRGEGVVAEGDPEARRRWLFEQTSATLDRLASQWPVVLVLEDVHWADGPSLLLLRYLARRPSALPLLIVCTYRTSELRRAVALDDVLADVARDMPPANIVLKGLPSHHVAVLVAQRVPDLAAPLAEDLARATNGNPFFIDQVLRHLLELRVRGNASPTATGSWREFGLPDQVRQVITNRCSRLSDASGALLRAASVLGVEWDFDTAVETAALEEEAALGAVDEALDARLIVAVDRSEEAAFTFIHALVRETLYDALSVPRRQRLHLRAAAAMEQRAGADADQLAAAIADHYRSAGNAADPQRAGSWLIRAGEQSARVFAYDDALRFWCEAADALRRAPHPSENVALARLLERTATLIFATATNVEIGTACLEEALTIYQAVGDESRAAQMHSRLGITYALPEHGTELDIPRALEHLAAAAPVLGHRRDRGGAYFLVAHAAAFMRDLRLDEAHVASEQALAIADSLADPVLWANAAVVHGWCIFEEGQLAPGITLVEQAYEVGTQAGSLLMQFLAAWNRSNSAVMLDDPRASLASCRRALDDPRIAPARGSARTLAYWAARALLELGQLDERRALLTAYEITDVRPAADLSQPDERRFSDAVEGLWTRVLATGDHWNAGFSMSSFFDCFDADVQRSELQRCRTVTEWAQTGNAIVIEVLARVRAALATAFAGNPETSAAELDRCRALTGDGQDWGFLPGRIDFAEAVTHGCAGNDANATEYAQRALDVWRASGHVWRQVQALLLLARFGHPSARTEAQAILQTHHAPPRWADQLSSLLIGD